MNIPPALGGRGFTPFCRLTTACDTFFFPLYLLLKFLSTQGWGLGLAPRCVFPLFTHWFLSSLKPQPLMQSSSNQRYDLGMALGNSHASAIVGEGKDKEFCCTVVEILSMRMAYAGPWSEMALLDFRSVFTSASFCEVLTKVKNRSIGKLHWDCHGKTLSVAAEAERLVSTGDGALWESIRRPGFEFGLSPDSLLDLVQLLKYLYIISVIYWPVFIDWFSPWLWVNIFLLLYMSSDFLLDGRHCEATWLSIWTLLPSFKQC